MEVLKRFSDADLWFNELIHSSKDWSKKKNQDLREKAWLWLFKCTEILSFQTGYFL